MVRPAALTPWISFALVASMAIPPRAKDNQAPVVVASPTLEPSVTAQASETEDRVIFETTAQVWKTNRRRVVPEPEAVADAPPQPLIVTSAVGIMDAMTSIVTVPWDIVASAFRKPKKFRVLTWSISGRLLDKAGRPRAFSPLTVTVDRFDFGRDASMGQAASVDAHADANGAFSVSLTGRIEKEYRAEISIYSESHDGKRVLERRVFDQ